jgi:dihydropteroate synthase
MFTLKSGSRELEINSPLIMGVVNLTPDSFYSASRAFSESEYIKIIDQMVSDGVDIIDLGGQSTRPGATLVSDDDEYNRINGALDYIRLRYPQVWVSIDTFHSKVARLALEKGAHIINDVTAGHFDKNIHSVVAEYDGCYVCMHMQGNPNNMQINPSYNDVTSEIADFFKSKIEECKKNGINSIIIDPGFGFGKTIEHNYEILNNLDLFVGFRYPVLAGFSRKSMLYKLLGTTPEKSLNGTTVLNTIGILKGVSILRVHDVKEAAESIKIFNAMKVFK